MKEIHFGTNTPYCWATDLHFDDAGDEGFSRFIHEVNDLKCKALFITGDISTGLDWDLYIDKISAETSFPIYFVLGNHDFYGSSIHETRIKATKLKSLTMRDPISLNSTTALIGVDGWSDALCGDFQNSTIKLNDYKEIAELIPLTKKQLEKKLNQLGKENALILQNSLEKAMKNHEKIIILTHVPPFREACLYRGQIADDNWAPHFVCQQIGDLLLDTFKDSSKEALVLCGHCHSDADIQILPNLRVISGGAKTGAPRVQGKVFV